MSVGTVERKEKKLERKQKRVSSREVKRISDEERDLRELRGLFIEDYKLAQTFRPDSDGYTKTMERLDRIEEITKRENEIVQRIEKDAKKVFNLARKSASIFKKEEVDAIIIARKSTLGQGTVGRKETDELAKARSTESAIEKITILILIDLKKLKRTLGKHLNLDRKNLMGGGHSVPVYGINENKEAMYNLKQASAILNDILKLIMREEEYERYALNMERDFEDKAK